MVGKQLCIRFSEQCEILKRLLKDGITEFPYERLDRIFKESERKWEANLDRFGSKRVKYLLIGEAPPWSPSGEVRYFYNTFSPPLNTRIWKTFHRFPISEHKGTALDGLADLGFLLVDSLPFAIKYTSKMRNSPSYKELVKGCVPHLLAKVNHRLVRWASEVKVALCFKLNGLAVIEALPKGLPLGNGQTIRLDRGLIAADESGYPNSERLRTIFDIFPESEMVSEPKQFSRKTVAQNLDPEDLVTFKEMLLANSIQVDAICQLLIEKGIITEEEFCRKLKEVQGDYEDKR